MRLTLRFLALAAMLLLTASHLLAQAGQLDTTFANKGIFATTTQKSTANGVAIQSDGKIVIAGTGLTGDDFADTLIRLNTDGSLDSTFGIGGVANIQVPSNSAQGFIALAIQPDGKILAAGVSAASAAATLLVVRVNSNGSLDTTFGNGGFSTAAIPFSTSGSLALQSDGKILLVSGGTDPAVMGRLNSNGQVDTTFGTGGMTNLVFDNPTQVAVQSDGNILVASGVQSIFTLQARPMPQPGAITRYNSDGSLDHTFGSAGMVASVASASSLLVQSDGKIVAAGTLTSKLNPPVSQSDFGFGIVRYLSNGAVDKSFGQGGVAVADFGSNAPISGDFAVAIQSNGDLVVAGSAGGLSENNDTNSSFGLARFTSAGKLDTTFGTQGRVITTIGTNQFSWVNALAIQSDGKIVAAGTSHFDIVMDNAYVARYLSQ